MGSGTQTGFVLKGVSAEDRFGSSVSGAGDVNDDGIEDLIIGARYADPNGSGSGESYVIFGRTDGFAASFDLSNLDGTDGFAIPGLDSSDYSGVVSGAGDVNGDGIDDLIIGAPYADPNGTESGESYVIFGRSDGFAASFDLSNLDGTDGFVVPGLNPGDLNGRSVSGAGDVNGDGIEDMIIGAPDAYPNYYGLGENYVVFGRSDGFAASLDLSDLDGTDGFVVPGKNANVFVGAACSGAGDVNGDGIDDIIIGADDNDPIGSANGKSFVIFGRSDGFAASLDLSRLDGSDGFTIAGIDPGDYLGGKVSGAGDVNGDGIDDLIIGAAGADPNGSRSGESYVVFGRSDGFAASLDLSSLDGSDGFVIPGKNEGDLCGSVSGAGDVNGDGIDDIIIGAHGAGPNGPKSGESYVIFGRSDGFAASLDLSALNGSDGFALAGIASDDWSGSPVSGAGDVDGDGVDDLIIGASNASANGPQSGESYVIFGGGGNLTMLDRISGSVDGRIELAVVGALVGTDGPDTLDGTGNIDSVYGLKGADTILGFAGDDRLFGRDGPDRIGGGDGADELYGGRRADYLTGWTGDDRLFGDKGPDTLRGGSGEDVLKGGQGKDTLFGGDGADTFRIEARDGKRDRIRDFEDGTDLIDLRGWDIRFADLTLIDETAGQVRIEIEGEALVLNDDGDGLLMATDLTSDDFLF